jgi:hypothetical protein
MEKRKNALMWMQAQLDKRNQQQAPGSPTGEYQQYGRPIYRTPWGENYSEKSVTFALDDAQSTWVNVPSVVAGGVIVEDEDLLYQYYKMNDFMDPITGQPIQTFPTMEDALNVARSRSDGMRSRRAQE